MTRNGSKKALDRLIDEMDNHAPALDRASSWCYEFSGLAKGRMLLARGSAEEGEALIEKHLPRIRTLGFAPGQPMADRNRFFFSPAPLSSREAQLFDSLGTFKTKKEFPISDEKLQYLIATVRNRFCVG